MIAETQQRCAEQRSAREIKAPRGFGLQGAPGSGGASYCNPADWFCNYLSLRAETN